MRALVTYKSYYWEIINEQCINYLFRIYTLVRATVLCLGLACLFAISIKLELSLIYVNLITLINLYEIRKENHDQMIFNNIICV